MLFASVFFAYWIFLVDEVYDGAIDPRKRVCSFEFLFRDKVGHGSKNCIFPATLVIVDVGRIRRN